jgi:DNA-binding response OmpR family regulator
VAKLLVVDSSAEDRFSISRSLREAGHDAVCAADAADALLMLQGGHFDAVIAEWRPANTSGVGFVDSLRRSPQIAGARILVTSAASEPREIALALESGVDDYLVKPSRPEELVARVNAALRR